MTARIDDLHRAADELARQWAVTAVANCGVVGAAHAASFSRTPLKNEVVQSTVGTMGHIDFTLS
ncbi:MAG: hypothetical protein JNK87_08730 [Bryobacterales bacterium]|nr:hypothetical protein [Bryobacterales bacterium]